MDVAFAFSQLGWQSLSSSRHRLSPFGGGHLSGRRGWCVAEEWEYGMMKETPPGREEETETRTKRQTESRERAEREKQEKEKEERKKRDVWKVRIGYALP